MRSRTSDWFETKIRYAKTQEDGTQKNVTEHYVVDALSFTEAEGAILEEMKVYISGDYKITDIKPSLLTMRYSSPTWTRMTNGTRLS